MVTIVRGVWVCVAGLIFSGSVVAQSSANRASAQTHGATGAPAVAAGEPVEVANARDILGSVKAAQYNLPKQGMQSFRCLIAIDWDGMYKELGADGDSARATLALLNKTRFKGVVGPDGSISLSHDSDDAPPNAEIAERVKRSEDGVDETITGLFKTWAGFMVSSVIPNPDEEYHLVRSGGEYRLTYGSEGTNIQVEFNSDLNMERFSYTASEIKAEFKLAFDPDPKGFVLSGYTAAIDSPNPSIPKHFDVSIENQRVNGLMLPHVAIAKIPSNDSTVALEMTFSDFQVTKK
jgi:hypothetical protein